MFGDDDEMSPEEFERRLREKWSGSGPEEGGPFGLGQSAPPDPKEMLEEFRDEMDAYAEELSGMEDEALREVLGWAIAYVLVQLQFSEGIIRSLTEQGAMSADEYAAVTLQLEVGTRCAMTLAAAADVDLDPERVLNTAAILRSYLGEAP